MHQFIMKSFILNMSKIYIMIKVNITLKDYQIKICINLENPTEIYDLSTFSCSHLNHGFPTEHV